MSQISLPHDHSTAVFDYPFGVVGGNTINGSIGGIVMLGVMKVSSPCAKRTNYLLPYWQIESAIHLNFLVNVADLLPFATVKYLVLDHFSMRCVGGLPLCSRGVHIWYSCVTPINPLK
jgi:hypothetical protein